MDVVERLTLEAAQADTMIACEHRQRYEFAAELCGGLRVLDLCCGSGYGIRDPRPTSAARWSASTTTRRRSRPRQAHAWAPASTNLSFELADAVAYLQPATCRSASTSSSASRGWSTCTELERALELLREHAERRAAPDRLGAQRQAVRRAQPVPRDRIRLRRGDGGVRRLSRPRDGARSSWPRAR